LASAVTSARIDLSWTAATDNVAVTNYAVYRGGALLTTLGNVTAYSDTAVTPGTLYSYQVKALDAKGNISGFSNSSSATTPQQLVTLNPAADARVEEANPSSNFGWIARGKETGAGNALKGFETRETGNAARRPQLVRRSVRLPRARRAQGPQAANARQAAGRAGRSPTCTSP